MIFGEIGYQLDREIVLSQIESVKKEMQNNNPDYNSIVACLYDLDDERLDSLQLWEEKSVFHELLFLSYLNMSREKLERSKLWQSIGRQAMEKGYTSIGANNDSEEELTKLITTCFTKQEELKGFTASKCVTRMENDLNMAWYYINCAQEHKGQIVNGFNFEQTAYECSEGYKKTRHKVRNLSYRLFQFDCDLEMKNYNDTMDRLEHKKEERNF